MNVSVIKKLLVLCLFVGLGVYGYFQTRPYLSGPIVKISEIASSPLHEQAIVVNGTARNVTYLSLNNRPLFTDIGGHFEETLLLLPGYNVLTIEATDRFGRNTIAQRQLYAR